jgi:hypothetical protein
VVGSIKNILDITIEDNSLAFVLTKLVEHRSELGKLTSSATILEESFPGFIKKLVVF